MLSGRKSGLGFLLASGECGLGRRNSRRTVCRMDVSPYLPTIARTQWKEIDGGKVVVVSPPESVTPRCVVHFLGGIPVNMSLRTAYPELLQALADNGLLVVATPFETSLNFMKVVDKALDRFDMAIEALDDDVIGSLPVVGVGHSTGALLHVLLSTLFPQKSRVANVLISYNFRSAEEAIPGFDSICSLFQAAGPSFFSAEDRDAMVDRAFEFFVSSSRKTPIIGQDLSPYVNESVGLIRQFRSLFVEIAEGSKEFHPDPEETNLVVRRGYDTLHTLLIKFKGDILDQSEVAEEILSGRTDLQIAELDGSHLTPLKRELCRLPVDPTLGSVVDPVRYSLIADVRDMEVEILQFLDGILPKVD